MKKQQTQKQVDTQIIYRKNRGRLIQQNRQLYSQIFRLQNKVSAVLTQNIAHDFKQTVQQQKLIQKHKELTKGQVAEIKKLKKKILLIKNMQKPQQKQDMRQAQDQLIFLKKQKQKYLSQKQALIKKRNLKNEYLELNKPVQEQKNRLLALYNAAQRQNFQLKNKNVYMQRQIVNLHKTKQLAKTSVPKIKQNHEFQISQIENQISKIKIEINKIQKEWQPRIQSLNTQFFVLKQIKQQKQEQIQNLQRAISSYKNRIIAMRQQQKIKQDKQRLAQITISPRKRQQIIAKYEIQKQKKQFFQKFRNPLRDNNIKGNIKQFSKVQQQKKQKKQKQEQIFEKIILKNVETDAIKQRKQQLKLTNLDYLSTKNQFAQLQQNLEQKKNNKIFTSVAVGTTFYFNEQEQIQNQTNY